MPDKVYSTEIFKINNNKCSVMFMESESQPVKMWYISAPPPSTFLVLKEFSIK